MQAARCWLSRSWPTRSPPGHTPDVPRIHVGPLAGVASTTALDHDDDDVALWWVRRIVAQPEGVHECSAAWANEHALVHAGDAYVALPVAVIAALALLMVQSSSPTWPAADLQRLRTLALRELDAAMAELDDDERNAWHAAMGDARDVLSRVPGCVWVEALVPDEPTAPGTLQLVPGMIALINVDGMTRIATTAPPLQLPPTLVRQQTWRQLALPPPADALWWWLQRELVPWMSEEPRLTSVVLHDDAHRYGHVEVAGVHMPLTMLGDVAGPLSHLWQPVKQIDGVGVASAWKRLAQALHRRADAAPAVLPASSWWWGSAWLRVLSRAALQQVLVPADGCAIDVEVIDSDDGPTLRMAVDGAPSFVLDPGDGVMRLDDSGEVVMTHTHCIDGDTEAAACVCAALGSALRGSELDFVMEVDGEDVALSAFLLQLSHAARMTLTPLHKHSAVRAAQWWRVVDALTTLHKESP
jgi:hypothetical protein